MATQGSSVVVFNDDRQVLLVLRADTRVWALPAGGLESGETFEQAAIREVREETGYDIMLERLVGEYWRPQFPNGGDRQCVFAGKVVSGDPTVHDREALEVKWFPLNALPWRLFQFSGEHIRDASAVSEIPINHEQRFTGPGAIVWPCFFLLRRLRNSLRG